MTLNAKNEKMNGCENLIKKVVLSAYESDGSKRL